MAPKRRSDHLLNHEHFLIPPGRQPGLATRDTLFTAGYDKERARAELLEDKSRLAEAQERLWASSEYAVLIILQAPDAGGKDGTIKHVMSGVNPQGVDVHGFKAPSEEERKHHFLWRPTRFLPARGRIAIFNRSYYEETLVVRVHPEFLDRQWLSRAHRKLAKRGSDALWRARFEEINDFERLLATSGVEIVKVFLHVSFEEQGKRLLARLDDPKKHWKFSESDFAERRLWPKYQEAYEEMIRATSTELAPWYVIPADRKWFARAAVADVIRARLGALDLTYPKVSRTRRAELKRIRGRLAASL